MIRRRGAPPGCSDRAHAEAGMTLVEMLVVLAIIGVAAGASLLAVGSGAGLDGKAEARRLQTRLQLAVDEAMVSGAPLALSLGSREYRFLEWDAGTQGWRPSASEVLREWHKLPRGMALASADGRRILLLDADQPGEPVTVSLSAGRQRWTVGFDGLTARVHASGAVQ